MKTNILKKINAHVRITESNGSYVVERRAFRAKQWEHVNTFSTLKQALHKKHIYIVMILMREMGYRNEFVRRRAQRKLV